MNISLDYDIQLQIYDWCFYTENYMEGNICNFCQHRNNCDNYRNIDDIWNEYIERTKYGKEKGSRYTC